MDTTQDGLSQRRSYGSEPRREDRDESALRTDDETVGKTCGENFHIPSRRWNSQSIWRRSGSENIHLNPGRHRDEDKNK